MRNNIMLVGILTISSGLIYLLQFLIFHRAEDTFFYMFQDLAFIPIQAAIVTIVINRFLNIMERRKKIKKINVIISTFFVETGTKMMTEMSRFDRNHNDFFKIIDKRELRKSNKYNIKKIAAQLKYDIRVEPDKLEGLAAIMAENRAYMLRMLENSNLLEHDSFTDMLWSVFHVADELQSRGDLKDINEGDIDHLSNDLLRAYSAVVLEWINYIIYLHDEYPFLYALEIRKNPFAAE